MKVVCDLGPLMCSFSAQLGKMVRDYICRLPSHHMSLVGSYDRLLCVLGSLLYHVVLGMYANGVDDLWSTMICMNLFVFFECFSC